MKPKNEYSIKIAGINYGWTNYQLCRNGQDVEPEDLTIEELELFQKEFYDFAEMFEAHIKYLKEL